MSNPSIHQQNSFCSSSHVFIPNKKRDFHQQKIPFIISLSPFSDKNENQIKYYQYSYCYVPKCCRCKAVSFPTVIKDKQENLYAKKSYWLCPICKQENLYKPSYLKIHSFFDSEFTAIDFHCPTLKKKPKFIESQPIFSYQNKSFLFVLELTKSTQNNKFFHEALICIKKQMENKNEGYVSIFIVNSHLHFPTIQKNGVTLTTTYDIVDNEFPPFQKIFFNLDSRKKNFLDFIDFIDSSMQNNSLTKDETTDVSIFNILQNITNLIQNKNIKCLFLVSQIVKDNEDHSIYKSFKKLTFSNIDNIYPFDFFLIENMNSNRNFDVLRENIFIANGYINFYNDSSSQIPFFSNDFCDRIDHYHYNKVDISAIIPPALKITEIHGCGVRISNDKFSLKTMDINDSIYYFIDFSSSEINNSESLNFQFQVIYHDLNNECRIRIINYQINAYDGLEMTVNNFDYGVIISGCINQAIDVAREEENVSKAVETMKKFDHIFNNEKNEKLLFQQNGSFQINCFQIILNSSIKNLYLPFFWTLILGKLPNDIQLLFSPFLYKINIENFFISGPFLTNNNFEPGIYLIILTKNRGALFAFGNENDLAIDLESNQKILDTFPKLKISTIHSPIQTINDLRKHVLILQ